MKSRKVMAAKNVFSAVMYYVINSIIGFVSRKAFTVYLGSELLGLNGLVSSKTTTPIHTIFRNIRTFLIFT